MAKSKKRIVIDFDASWEENLAEVIASGHSKVFEKHPELAAKAQGQFEGAGPVTAATLPQQAALLRALANQSLSGKDARARAIIREARIWYTGQTEGGSGQEVAGSIKSIIAPSEPPPDDAEPAPARGFHMEGKVRVPNGYHVGEKGMILADPVAAPAPLDIPVASDGRAAGQPTIDPALSKAIKALTPGRATGPTRKAAKVARARRTLEQVQLPEPGTLEYAMEKEREAREAQESQARINRVAGPYAREQWLSRSNGGLPALPAPGPGSYQQGKAGHSTYEPTAATLRLAKDLAKYGEYGYDPTAERKAAEAKKQAQNLAKAKKTKKPPKKYRGGGL